MMALISAQDAATILNVTPARMYQLARSNLVPAVRLGRSVRFDSVQIESFIKQGGAALPGGWRMKARSHRR
jgi:excisionase family DNA binding protein